MCVSAGQCFVSYFKENARFLKIEIINILEWPGNSLDINQIENLWIIIKRRLTKYDCTTMDRMICAIIQVCYHDNELKNKCGSLAKFMPNRILDLSAKEDI